MNTLLSLFSPCHRPSRFLLLCLLLSLSACGEGMLETGGEGTPEESDVLLSELSASQRRARVELIKRSAAERGLSNAVLLAGIAQGETQLAHCWSELRWACKGPASASCGGGPVVAGSGDGPCWKQQGGLGYFQFDGGTFDQTLKRDGRGILTVEGNTHKAVEFVINMVKRSDYIPGVSTDAQALSWLNGVRVDGKDWTSWIKTVTHYYNGCKPSYSCYTQRFGHYRDSARTVYREFGHAFWYGTPPAPAQPLTAPSGLSPQNVQVEQGGFVTMTWRSNDAGATFDVKAEYLPQGDDTWRDYHTWIGRSGQTFRMWPQFQDAKYRWSIRACRGTTCSPFSQPALFDYGNAGPSPLPAPPAARDVPGSMSPAGGTIASPSVDLTWEAVGGALTYDVHLMHRRTQGEVWREYYTWTGRPESRFEVWPQVDNTHYQWQVRACASAGCGPWSAWESFYFTGK